MIDFVIHAKYGTGRIYTAQIPRKVNRYNRPLWGKAYLDNWPYVRFHKTFKIGGVR